MIADPLYEAYLRKLLRGDAAGCTGIVQELLDGQTPMLTLYDDVFRRSLYDVGSLWEKNRISVAVEHLSTALTERLLAMVYPQLIGDPEPTEHRALVSCGANEFHQVGARMVADVLEHGGWDVRFLGANLPELDLLRSIDETRPQLLGLSLSMYFNMSEFGRLVATVRHHHPDLEILVGGQAFLWGGAETLLRSARVRYLPDLPTLAKETAR